MLLIHACRHAVITTPCSHYVTSPPPIERRFRQDTITPPCPRALPMPIYAADIFESPMLRGTPQAPPRCRAFYETYAMFMPLWRYIIDAIVITSMRGAMAR